jgi:PmbA protein
MTDLTDLCSRAVEAAQDDEGVEAFAEEGRRTQVRVRDGEVESLTFSESRGVGVRVLSGHRLGYAYAADPGPDEVTALVGAARDGARFTQADEANVLLPLSATEPVPGTYREALAVLDQERKVGVALDVERLAVTGHPEVRRVEAAGYGDAVTRVAIASTGGGPFEFARTDAWSFAVALAERDGETQTGYAVRLARDLDDLEWEDAATEAAERAARLLGGTKPATERLPVVLDPIAAASFLSVLSSALSAESVLKGRSPLANLVGSGVAGEAVSVVDDGRFPEGPAVAPFDGEGVPTGRTTLIERGTLLGFLHNVYTATRADERSTGNASRASYRTTPGVGPTNLYLEPGTASVEALLRDAGRAVYVQEMTGLHSGANPVSGEFSVGATGLRVEGGALAAPLREMTIASTMLDLLRGISSLASDLRFPAAGPGAPTVLVMEMTVGGTSR